MGTPPLGSGTFATRVPVLRARMGTSAAGSGTSAAWVPQRRNRTDSVTAAPHAAADRLRTTQRRMSSLAKRRRNPFRRKTSCRLCRSTAAAAASSGFIPRRSRSYPIQFFRQPHRGSYTALEKTVPKVEALEIARLVTTLRLLMEPKEQRQKLANVTGDSCRHISRSLGKLFSEGGSDRKEAIRKGQQVSGLSVQCAEQR